MGDRDLIPRICFLLVGRGVSEVWLLRSRTENDSQRQRELVSGFVSDEDTLVIQRFGFRR